MATLHLNIIDVLRNARSAFDEGRLQLQQTDFLKSDGGCMYTGPCAIGASMPHHIALEMDGDNGSVSIKDLMETGRITCDAPMDLCTLQCAHDNAYNPEGFEGALIMLEQKHGLR